MALAIHCYIDLAMNYFHRNNYILLLCIICNIIIVSVIYPQKSCKFSTLKQHAKTVHIYYVFTSLFFTHLFPGMSF